MPVDPQLELAAARFGQEVLDLLQATICEDAPIASVAQGDRVVVSAFNPEGDETAIPLQVAGTHRLDLKVRYLCAWDSTGHYLAVEGSKVSLALPHQEQIFRFEYEKNRSFAPAHIQVHGENSGLGWVLALQELSKPPKIQFVHLPVGGKRFRPSLEEVIEFAVRELGVDTQEGWETAIHQGLARWNAIQLASAMRDAIREDPNGAPERLRQQIAEITAAMAGELDTQP